MGWNHLETVPLAGIKRGQAPALVPHCLKQPVHLLKGLLFVAVSTQRLRILRFPMPLQKMKKRQAIGSSDAVYELLVGNVFHITNVDNLCKVIIYKLLSLC